MKRRRFLASLFAISGITFLKPQLPAENPAAQDISKHAWTYHKWDGLGNRWISRDNINWTQTDVAQPIKDVIFIEGYFVSHPGGPYIMLGDNNNIKI